MQKTHSSHEEKRQIDIRFAEIYEELKDMGKEKSLLRFADRLGVHATNLHAIFRSARGETKDIRHVNEPLIRSMRKAYLVNEAYLLNGTLPKYVFPAVQKYASPIQAIMAKFELKQSDLASLVNRSQSQISEYSKGNIPVDVMRTLNKELFIPFEFMINYDGNLISLEEAIMKVQDKQSGRNKKKK